MQPLFRDVGEEQEANVVAVEKLVELVSGSGVSCELIGKWCRKL